MNDESVVVIARREDPCTLDGRMLVDEAAACAALYAEDGGQARFCVDDVRSSRSAFVIARAVDGHAIGCGALRRLSFEVAELKRIYRRPEWRGVGALILTFLETAAHDLGYRRVVLQTREANRRAIAFYHRHGYATTEPFGVYAGVGDARCFMKALPPPREM
ncbi:acetyltransferase (GNAT) family protein [Paraburkholderia tropica]|uniref:Acetyltransferase (GNAT) family protein n=1 Tax=Paraburkholderia tropica TaxID=92647 RepID=A0ABX5MDY5_9BURK|nr:acetyltransferase (GNAT) family protein [Paraburkholderia tropica]PZW72506.1 acetyltransferase (GNAT) family protein [Paraburkholderia tropica]